MARIMTRIRSAMVIINSDDNNDGDGDDDGPLSLLSLSVEI